MKPHLIVSFIVLLFVSGQANDLDQKTWGIGEGEKAPQIKIKDIEGKAFNLHKESKQHPIVLVFYRGGWCPYCNVQLRALQAELLPELSKAGAQLVAISVDRLEEALKSQKNESLGFRVISDPVAKTIKDYQIAYKVPADLVKKYKVEYKIDLEKASGKKHYLIAVPSVFIVDRKQQIAFSYSNEDYKKRADNKKIIETLKSLENGLGVQKSKTSGEKQ